MKRLSLFIITALLAAPAYGAATDFFRISMSARQLGMGKTSVSSVIDSNGVLGNPAILGFVTKPEASSLYSKLGGDVDFVCLSTVMPDPVTGTKGLGLVNFGIGGFYTTSRDPITGRLVPGATFDYSSQIYVLAYGKEIGNEFSVGGSLNVYRESFSGTSGADAMGYGLALGLVHYLNPGLRFGFVSRNMLSSGMQWSTGYNAALPFVNKGGITFLPDERVSTALELEIQPDHPITASFGVEWRPFGRHLQLRGGAFQSPASSSMTTLNLTGGVGFSVDGVSFDYAYCHDTELEYNSSHFFSINLGERVIGRAKREEPEVEPVPEIVTPEAGARREIDPKAEARINYLKQRRVEVLDYIRLLETKLSNARRGNDRGRISKVTELLENEAKRVEAIDRQISHLESM